MMLLNLSGQPLDDHMLKVISLIPGKSVYVSLEEIEEYYIEYLQDSGDILCKLLIDREYQKTVFYHQVMCNCKDILDDINTIKNFQQIYSDFYKALEVER